MFLEEAVGILTVFERLVDELKKQEGLTDDAALQSFLRQKHHENTHSFSLMKTVKLLTKVSESVCLILVEGSAKGTGFLLFDRFVLTSGHVVQDELDPETQSLTATVTAMFGFEGPGTGEKLQVNATVVAYHHKTDDGRKLLDFALLELSDDVKLPACCPLRISFSPPSTCEGICIVGHPDGGDKAMDPCVVFNKDFEKAQKSENILHIMSKKCLDNKGETNNSQITYNSWFFHGSSGSPVFNEWCEVIGVHSGGYAYEDERGQTKRVMEYALPMLPILAHIYKQAKERGRLDIMKYIKYQSNMEAVIHTADHLQHPAGEEQHGLEEADGASPYETIGLLEVFAQKMHQPCINPASKLFDILHADFDSLLRKFKEQKNLKDDSDVHTLFREEYDKSVDCFSEVNKVKKLMDLSNSVCLLRNGYGAKGTGFLLFGNFVLTNAHVIGETDPNTKKLLHPLTAVFNYETVGSKAVEVPVKDEVVVSFQEKVGKQYMDFALLELSRNVEYDPILSPSNKHCFFPFGSKVSGGTCIIGHPHGGIKKLDFCLIIPKNERDQAIQRHLMENPNNFYIITPKYNIENLPDHHPCITYNTCLFHGSSGSPVFNEDCKLIGIHTGGFPYQGEGGTTRSVIEYALPMDDTLKCITRQLRMMQKANVLWNLCSCLSHC